MQLKLIQLNQIIIKYCIARRQASQELENKQRNQVWLVYHGCSGMFVDMTRDEEKWQLAYDNQEWVCPCCRGEVFHKPYLQMVELTPNCLILSQD